MKSISNNGPAAQAEGFTSDEVIDAFGGHVLGVLEHMERDGLTPEWFEANGFTPQEVVARVIEGLREQGLTLESTHEAMMAGEVLAALDESSDRERITRLDRIGPEAAKFPRLAPMVHHAAFLCRLKWARDQRPRSARRSPRRPVTRSRARRARLAAPASAGDGPPAPRDRPAPTRPREHAAAHGGAS